MQNIDLEGLSEKQLMLIARFVAFVREAGQQQSREEASRAWAEWTRLVPKLPEAEVEALVAEAVAHARQQA